VDECVLLFKIKEILGVGRVQLAKQVQNGKEVHLVEYVIDDFEGIKNVIRPIFESRPLLTEKSLNFKYFKQAFNIKLSVGHGVRLPSEKYQEILNIKNKMNSNLSQEEVKA
jgi:hypothetical protein